MKNIEKLLEIMATLRDPNDGCPWDVEQDFSSIAPYTVEEAYEVADAIERGALDELRGELGDLLLQVVFHAQMAKEQGLFEFEDVAAAINEKLIRRHPHVFGDAEAGSAADMHQSWEAHKQAERAAAGTAGEGVLDGIAANLPALTLATKTGKRASRVGFDWDTPEAVLDKIHEELGELADGRARNDADNIEEELGDLLLAITSLARHLDVDPEKALRRSNRKFAERFRRLERSLQEEQADWADFSLDELEARYQSLK